VGLKRFSDEAWVCGRPIELVRNCGVPWCEPCSRFYTPTTLTDEGNCPAGHHVADPSSPVLVQSSAPPREDVESVRPPWHFWLLVLALVLYLGWRAVQGIQWIIG